MTHPSRDAVSSLVNDLVIAFGLLILYYQTNTTLFIVQIASHLMPICDKITWTLSW